MMKQYYYTRASVLTTPVYLLASDVGLMYVTSQLDDDFEFFEEIKEQLNIEAKQCIEHKQMFEPYIEQLKRFEQGQSMCYDQLSFDLQGTAFQKQIWQSLLTIEFGETTYYQAIADKIGNRQAVRAVGRAIGANPLLLFVPCHRVIGKNGALTGFSEGIDLKRKWLEHEQAYKL